MKRVRCSDTKPLKAEPEPEVEMYVGRDKKL